MEFLSFEDLGKKPNGSAKGTIFVGEKKFRTTNYRAWLKEFLTCKAVWHVVQENIEQANYLFRLSDKFELNVGSKQKYLNQAKAIIHRNEQLVELTMRSHIFKIETEKK